MAAGPVNAMATEANPRRLMEAVGLLNERLECLNRALVLLQERLEPALLPDCPRAVAEDARKTDRPAESRYVTDLLVASGRVEFLDQMVRNIAERVQT